MINHIVIHSVTLLCGAATPFVLAIFMGIAEGKYTLQSILGVG
jgi:hypothetical protein